MDTAETDRAQRHTRTLERRAARARRSRWLGRVLFSLTGMGLLLLIRMNPDMVGTIVAWSHNASAPAPERVLTPPSDIRISAMPGNSVPVRRGATPPGHGTRAPQQDANAQADAVADTLRSLSPGN